MIRSRRIVHSMKMALALTLVSIIYYVRPLYDSFGVAAVWAVMTVVVVSEFTVGATISKCLNRDFATLLAGALGILAEYLARLSGDQGKPILLGVFVFFLAAASTFTRFFPKVKARYDYGVLIFILTFSLVAVSGARVTDVMELALQRLSTIIIGASTCLVISIFVYPVWAGEDLHNLVALNLENLSHYIHGRLTRAFIRLSPCPSSSETHRYHLHLANIESCAGFGGEYFKERSNERPSTDEDEAVLHAYRHRSIINSKATVDNLVNFARWEPGHGGFGLRHPWKKYSHIAALTRECASHIEALNASVTFGIKASAELQARIQKPCAVICSESSQALRCLSLSIREMTDHQSSLAEAHIRNSKTAAEDLTLILKTQSLDTANVLGLMQTATAASVLISAVTKIDRLAEAISELSKQAKFKSSLTSSPTLSTSPC
uniref:Aluminum-activated malate transporter n=1 Tax=Kalanchoe fedtschenkoi TaxID=63787 RepID=A0A7N0RGU3_KALFE